MSDPSSTSITKVANRWGFWHMGQFASDYRKLFVELPSDTLGRRSQRMKGRHEDRLLWRHPGEPMVD